MQLISEKPETEAVVKEKLTGLHKMWEVLESTTQTKAQRLFDANKAELFTQSCADLDKWLHGLESQIQSDDYGKDLTSVNILLKKQQVSKQGSHLRGLFLFHCRSPHSSTAIHPPCDGRLTQHSVSSHSIMGRRFQNQLERNNIGRSIGCLCTGILFLSSSFELMDGHTV